MYCYIARNHHNLLQYSISKSSKYIATSNIPQEFVILLPQNYEWRSLKGNNKKSHHDLFNVKRKNEKKGQIKPQLALNEYMVIIYMFTLASFLIPFNEKIIY